MIFGGPILQIGTKLVLKRCILSKEKLQPPLGIGGNLLPSFDEKKLQKSLKFLTPFPVKNDPCLSQSNRKTKVNIISDKTFCCLSDQNGNVQGTYSLEEESLGPGNPLIGKGKIHQRSNIYSMRLFLFLIEESTRTV